MPTSKQTVKKISHNPVVKTKLAARVAKKSGTRLSAPVSSRTPSQTPEISPSVKHALISIAVLGIDGLPKGKINLPAGFFDAKVNPVLVAQAVRVYLANQREGGAATKTRGGVEGSSRKIYRQKGTGRARHGGVRAPIFVGGGVAFGPHPRDYHLDMPQKMKRAALGSALTATHQEGRLLVVDGLGSFTKTKQMAAALGAIKVHGSTLLVIPAQAREVFRTARNISGLDTLSVQSLHAYPVSVHQTVVFMKEAVEQVSKGAKAKL
ncbi:50S ribosomal protein L4 [Candidatus Gottesmanbacteria bacterium]|nr:50S ribosomal protein L4 [Candidatus Gottesmanbacteria bacterium]